MPRFATMLVLVAALAAQSAVAQTVRGSLVDSVSRVPLPATLVTLIDERGTERAHAVSDQTGQYVLTAPAAGSYRIRAKRIGFRPLVSPALTLSATDSKTYNIAIEAIPIALEEVVVAGDRQCDVEAGASTAELWEEVRAALSAVASSSRSPTYHYDFIHFERDLTPGGKPLGPDSSWHQQVEYRAKPESLAMGWVIPGDNWVYQAPDADALLSDEFLHTHCFETKIGRGTTEGLVGLGFSPARGGKRPDVTGTLWIDRFNAELRFLEFKYTRLPQGIDAPQAGGRIQFLRLPTGAWVVRDWALRTPFVKESVTPTGQRGPPVVYAYRELGAHAFEIKASNGAVVFRADEIGRAHV